MLGGLMQIVAPPLAALLLQVLPLQTIMLVDITTAALAITLVYLTHIPQPEQRGHRRQSVRAP